MATCAVPTPSVTVPVATGSSIEVVFRSTASACSISHGPNAASTGSRPLPEIDNTIRSE